MELNDLDGDGKPDVLLAGHDSPETMLFDLDNDTAPELATEQALGRLVAEEKWDFELAARMTRLMAALSKK